MPIWGRWTHFDEHIFRWVGSTTIQTKRRTKNTDSEEYSLHTEISIGNSTSEKSNTSTCLGGCVACQGWLEKTEPKKKPGCLSYIDLYRGELYCIPSWTGSCMAVFFVVAIVWGSLWTNQKNGKCRSFCVFFRGSKCGCCWSLGVVLAGEPTQPP